MARLATLSESDRALVLAKLSLLAQTSAIDSQDARDVQMWAAAVAEELSHRTHSTHSTARAKQALGTRAAWAPVKEQLDALAYKGCTAAQRAALLRFLARVLVHHADGIAAYTSTPLTIKFAANCVAQLGGLVDRAFPGYARAGLLHIVALKITSTEG